MQPPHAEAFTRLHIQHVREGLDSWGGSSKLLVQVMLGNARTSALGTQLCRFLLPQAFLQPKFICLRSVSLAQDASIR